MKRFSNILYVVGSGPNESTAFGRAVELANTNQAKLTVVSVIEDIIKLNAKALVTNNLVDNIILERREQILVGLDYDPDNPENETLNSQMLSIASSLALLDEREYLDTLLAIPLKLSLIKSIVRSWR